jgi:hypothetical protein
MWGDHDLDLQIRFSFAIKKRIAGAREKREVLAFARTSVNVCTLF